MTEFTYLFRGRQEAQSPEQQQKTMEKWMAWFRQLGEGGHISNPGHPLQFSGKVVNGSRIVKDGPYAEAKDVIGGFTIVRAESLDQAAELAKGCPILEV